MSVISIIDMCVKRSGSIWPAERVPRSHWCMWNSQLCWGPHGQTLGRSSPEDSHQCAESCLCAPGREQHTERERERERRSAWMNQCMHEQMNRELETSDYGIVPLGKYWSNSNKHYILYIPELWSRLICTRHLDILRNRSQKSEGIWKENELNYSHTDLDLTTRFGYRDVTIM